MKNIFGPIKLDWFQRASSQRYIPEIDGLRFLAIMPVLLVHFSGALLTHNVNYDRALMDQENAFRQFLLLGNSGVHLFFGISGFILTLPLINRSFKEIDFKNYYKRRLIRIEPPYLIAISIFFLVHIALGVESVSFLFEHYIASFFYVHNIVFLDRSYILPPAWSLEVEVQFYLLMPLFLLLFKLYGKPIWRYFMYLILLVLSFKIDIIPIGDLNDFMKFFVAGIFAADLYKNKKFNSHWLWDVVFVISVLVFYSRYTHLLMSVSLFFMIISAFNTVYLKPFLTNRIITIIGGMCYTLYLLHYPLYHLIMKVLTNRLSFFESFEMNYLFQASLLLPISIVLMSLYFLAVEKPFMVLSQRLTRKPKPELSRPQN